jgi:8-oxo-dGTP diphosphatase
MASENEKIAQVGVAVLLRKGDQVLLIKRQGSHGAGAWAPPGGHIDFGETPEACGIRETQEEVGLAIDGLAFMGITNDVFKSEDRHYITVWMEARYAGGEPRVNAPREMSEVEWFAWDALPEPLFLPLANLVAGQMYRAGAIDDSR